MNKSTKQQQHLQEQQQNFHTHQQQQQQQQQQQGHGKYQHSTLTNNSTKQINNQDSKSHSFRIEANSGREDNLTKHIEHKIRHMEIAGGGGNNNVKNTLSIESNDSLANNLNNTNNNNNNNNNLLDYPPNKKLLTSNNLLSNSMENNNKMEMDDVNIVNNKSLNNHNHTDDDENSVNNNNNNSSNQNENHDESMQQVDESQTDEDESRAEATFQLVINDFSKFKESKESRLSPTPCTVRNLPWKILAMSKQINNKEFVLGFFLQCNADSESTRWSVCAAAELRLLHLTDPSKNLIKKIQHLFYLKENDWGFSPFITMKELMDPEKGFYNSQTDSITLEVWLHADAPHGTAWDSKKLTGYVGLTNQGATCYMNSLLQTLYFTSQLRKAVYLMPTENDDPIKSVPYALQRVFYDLQFFEKSVGTKKLTRSFGWETLDTFMQHDVQELCRVLMDNLENKMKHTNVDGIIPELFEGKMISYVKCKTIDYESRRVENYYDIQLNIKGKKDIYESFKDYITVETLDGENKYDAGKFGLQEAQKGVIFESFPPVLHLHLMRFQYDPHTDSNIKINDRYEFFEHIELDQFLDKPQTTPAKYSLHAVLVHSGDNHGGHYVVFINPKLDGKWFKFDDEVVSRCSKKDAINANFGGNDSSELTFRHSTNAYMLVYVRDSHKHVVLTEVKRQDIPQVLQDKLQEEKRIEMIRKKERNEAHLYMQLNLILEKEFYENLGNSDLFDQSKVEATKQLKVKKSSTIEELMKQLSELLNQPPEEIRVWPIMNRYNNTTRPLNCIDIKEHGKKTVHEVSKQDSFWLLFVETASDLSFSNTFNFNLLMNQELKFENLVCEHELQMQQQLAPKLPAFNPKDEVMIFFKYYDPKTSTLRYVFRMILSINSTLINIQDKINKKMRFPLNTELLFFEEVKITQITPLVQRDVSLEILAHEQLLDGDIYVFQINEKEKLQQYKLPYVVDYFKDLSYQAEVMFYDKTLPNDDGFTLNLSLKMKYDEFARVVGQHIKHDPDKIQFFRTNSYELKVPSQAIKYNPEFQLKDAFNANNLSKQQVRKLFYQKMTIKMSEMDERKQFKCLWVSCNLKVERDLLLMPMKKATVKELLLECRMELLKEELITQQQCDNLESFRLRLVEVVASKMHRIIREDTLIEQLETQIANRIYRIEQVQPDEFDLSLKSFSIKGEDYLLPVAHFCKEIYATFGTPFLLRVRQGELFKDIRQRIQRKLDINDKEFGTYRFAIINMGTATYIPSDDEQFVFDLSNLSGMQTWLGIDHTNKLANKSKNRLGTMEKAIKIFN